MDDRVDVVLSSNRVRREQSDDLGGGEPGITHASEDLVGGIKRLRDGTIGSQARVVRPTGEELKARPSVAVGDRDGTSELYAVVV